MNQIFQSLRNGSIQTLDVPCPQAKEGHILIRSSRTLISAGTERMVQEFGRAGLIGKARQNPDRVRAVVEKALTDGVAATIDAVRTKLDQLLPLGYCNVGRVLEVGAGVADFRVGDRVVSNGNHAEVVCVPKNLCAHVPDEVSDESAAFTVLAAVALQGIRLAQPTFGELFVVTGLGLVGLMTVQLLRANGCRVLGIDLDPQRAELAREFGASTVVIGEGDDPLAAADKLSRGRGVDGVLVTAATNSNTPVRQAAQMCRKRGRIVLVGVAGLELSRSDFYAKELSFQVSCSYGPGRYDPYYEEHGHDYPFGFVRWSEQRNFEAVLQAMAAGQLDTSRLVTHRFRCDSVQQAYDGLCDGQSALGVLLEYPDTHDKSDAEITRTTVRIPATQSHRNPASSARKASPAIAFLGTGGFSEAVLIPAFAKTSARLKVAGARSGNASARIAEKLGIEEATTNVDSLFDRDDVDAIVIATRHDSHAQLVCRGLLAGKHVFVEKPLALTADELAEISDAYDDACHARGCAPLLMVGFNRRFAPHIQKIASLLDTVREPKAFVMTINAGQLAADHWAHDAAIGGGRIVGEGCHFVDLLRYLAGHPIVSLQAAAMGSGVSLSHPSDRVTLTLGFADGSLGTIHYLSNGHRRVAKERLEIFTAGRSLQLDNFRRLRGFGWPTFKKMNLWRQSKGHDLEAQAFIDAIQAGAPAPIPFEQLIEVSQVVLDVEKALETGDRIRYASDPPSLAWCGGLEAASVGG